MIFGYNLQINQSVYTDLGFYLLIIKKLFKEFSKIKQF